MSSSNIKRSLSDAEKLEITEQYCREKKWRIQKAPPCPCGWTCVQVEIKGYGGEITMGCQGACERCPRCHQPFSCAYWDSTHSDKYADTGTCYECEDSCSECDEYVCHGTVTCTYPGKEPGIYHIQRHPCRVSMLEEEFELRYATSLGLDLNDGLDGMVTTVEFEDQPIDE